MEDKVPQTVFQLSPLKTSAQIFFQKCWPIIGKHIIHVVQGSLNNSFLLKVLSKTYITLIPKKEALEGFGLLTD